MSEGIGAAAVGQLRRRKRIVKNDPMTTIGEREGCEGTSWTRTQNVDK